MTPIRTFLGLVCGAAACLTVAACDYGAKMYCAAPYSPAVIVTPLDSGTRANVAVGTRGAVRSGTYVDSLRIVNGSSTLWGGGPIGTYEVTVEHQGYRQWVRSGVRVTEQTDCGMPVSVPVTALLQPSP